MVPVSELIVDSVLAVLLVTVIVVSLIVYRKLSIIKEGQAELRVLVDQLNAAVVEAQRSVAGLKTSADEAEVRLKRESQRATAIADELSLITEAGNNLASRIEKGLTGPEAAAAKPKDGNNKEQAEILSALREAR